MEEKNMKSKSCLFILLATCFMIPSPIRAQQSAGKTQVAQHLYFNADWQINGVANSNFVQTISGWGANLEGGYYLTEHFALGGFLAFHTNNEYIPYRSILWENAALSTEQQHSLFQIPFGVSARYRFLQKLCAPYVGVKLGAQYTNSETYLNRLCLYNHLWGFYISPEIGVEIFPFAQKRFGIHLACYYSYSTNDHGILWDHSEGVHNYGLRVGLAF